MATDGGKIKQSGLRKHEWSGPGGGLGSFSHRVKNSCSSLWRRKWQPTPVLLPGKFHGQRSLVGYSPWGHKELDMTERLHFTSLLPFSLTKPLSKCLLFFLPLCYPTPMVFAVFFLSYFYICLSTGKKRKAQPRSWELCFIWQIYQGLKLGCSLSDSSEGLFWKDKGGARMYRVFATKTKELKNQKATDH